MAGNVEGGRKAMATNKQRYGKDFPEKIGRMGGLISRGGGFQYGSELAKEAGAKGGRTSRRRKAIEVVQSENTALDHEHKSWLQRVFGK